MFSQTCHMPTSAMDFMLCLDGKKKRVERKEEEYKIRGNF